MLRNTANSDLLWLAWILGRIDYWLVECLLGQSSVSWVAIWLKINQDIRSQQVMATALGECIATPAPQGKPGNHKAMSRNH